MQWGGTSKACSCGQTHIWGLSKCDAAEVEQLLRQHAHALEAVAPMRGDPVCQWGRASQQSIVQA